MISARCGDIPHISFFAIVSIVCEVRVNNPHAVNLSNRFDQAAVTVSLLSLIPLIVELIFEIIGSWRATFIIFCSLNIAFNSSMEDSISVSLRAASCGVMHRLLAKRSKSSLAESVRLFSTEFAASSSAPPEQLAGNKGGSPKLAWLAILVDG